MSTWFHFSLSTILFIWQGSVLKASLFCTEPSSISFREELGSSLTKILGVYMVNPNRNVITHAFCVLCSFLTRLSYVQLRVEVKASALLRYVYCCSLMSPWWSECSTSFRGDKPRPKIGRLQTNLWCQVVSSQMCKREWLIYSSSKTDYNLSLYNAKFTF